jgi:hypothetical protein
VWRAGSEVMAQQVSVRHFLLSWTHSAIAEYERAPARVAHTAAARTATRGIPHSAPVTRVRHLRQRFQQSGADRICRPRSDGGNDGQVAGYQAGRRR